MEIIALETKWFYRLVKVMYVFFLAVGLIGVICFGWGLKPYQLIDTQKSYLTCPDGTKHSFDSLDLYFYTKSSFSHYDVEKTMERCSKHPIKSSDPNEFHIENYARAEGDPYPTHWIYKIEGSWIEAIELWFLGSLVVFLIFNGIKQSLLYIVYGKKITFSFVNKTSKKLMRS